MEIKTKPRWILISLVVAGLSIAMGCNSATDEHATGSVQFASSIPQALAGDDVTRVTVTLTAPGIPSATTTLALVDGTWSGTLHQIPAGADRTFTAEAFDATGALRYRGQALGVSILAGETAIVAITLQSLDAPPPFDNAVPIIDSLVASASRVLPGGNIALRATAHDPDELDTLTYSWAATGGAFTTAGAAIMTWTAPQAPGVYGLTLTVTDSRGAAASIRLDITVVAVDSEQGSATINVSFNTSPMVRRIIVARSPMPVGQSTTVTVDAVDGDGDALTYQWTAACAGTWTDADSSSAAFTPSEAPTGAPCGSCPLTVVVTDGHGGHGEGTLHLCVGPSIGASIPPSIVLAHQSAASIAGGGNVTLRVLAEDGDGSALTFEWTASAGTVGPPTDGFTSSEVQWTAPTCAAVGAPPSITATVTNTRGFSASHTFNVSVINGTDCGSGAAARWNDTGSMLTTRGRYAALLLPSGKVLVAGGANASMLASAEIYSPDTGTWSPAGSMSTVRRSHTMTLLLSGKVLVTGGATSTLATPTDTRSADIYDPETNTWTAATPMAFERYGHTATLLPSGKVLVIGGTSSGTMSRIPELYDPETDTWVAVASMNATNRRNHAALLLPSGRVLVVGGAAASELYDPETDTWALATGVSGTSWTDAFLLQSGRVLLTAGRSLAFYDPHLNIQTNAGTFIHERDNQVQVRLASGNLLVTGGSYSHSAISELFDPITGRTAFTTNMPAMRYYAKGVLLASGKVLVAGGISGTYTNTAVLYTP